MSIHRFAARKDSNHRACVNAFRVLGCLVQPVSGKGIADLVVGCGDRMRWVEVKDGAKVKSARKLTPEQVTFHALWSEHVHIVESVGDVMRLVGEWRKPR